MTSRASPNKEALSTVRGRIQSVVQIRSNSARGRLRSPLACHNAKKQTA